MSTENIDIVINDRVPDSITVKLNGMATAADKTATSLERLQYVINSINGNGLINLQNQLAATVTEAGRLAQAFAALQAGSTRVGAGEMVQALGQQATAAMTAVSALDRLAGAYDGLAGAAARSTAALANNAVITSAATAMNNLGAEIRTLQTTLTTVGTKFTAHNEQLSRTTTNTNKAATATHGLRNVFVLMMAVQFGGYLRGLVDDYTSLENRIRTVTASTAEAKDTIKSLFDIANETRAPIATLATLFQQAGLATRELGVSANQSKEFVKAIGQAIAIQGGTATSARGALIQLSQALGSGVVRAEEFNSMLEGAFTVVSYAAKGIDRMGGSVAKLRQEVVNGKVSSAEFFNAILSQSQAIDAQFSKSSITIGQAFTILQNKLIEFVGTSHIAADTTAVITITVAALANNIDILGRSIIGATVAFSMFKIIDQFRQANVAVQSIIVANAAANQQMMRTAFDAAGALSSLRSQVIALWVAQRTSTAEYTAAKVALNALPMRDAINQTVRYTAAVTALEAAEHRRALATAEVRVALAGLKLQEGLAVVSTDAMRATTVVGVLRERIRDLVSSVVIFARANPFIIWATGAATALGTLYAFSDKLMISSKHAITLHDAIVTIARVTSDAFGLLARGIALSIEGWVKLTAAFINTPFRELQRLADLLGLDVDISFYGLIRSAVSAADVVINVFAAMSKVVQNQFSFMGKSSARIMQEELKKSRIGDYLFADIDAALNTVTVQAQKTMKELSDSIKDMGIKSDRFIPQFSETDLSKMVKTLQDYKRELNNEITLLGAVGVERTVLTEQLKLEDKLRKDVATSTANQAVMAKRQREELAAAIKQKEDLKAVSQVIDKLYTESQAKRVQDYVLGLRAVNEAVAKHIITTDEATIAMAKLKYEYQQVSLTPAAKAIKDITDQLERQQALAGKVGIDLSKATTVFDAQQKVKSVGGTLSASDIKTLEDLSATIYQLNKDQEYLTDVFSKAQDPMEKYLKKMGAANKLYNEGKINLNGLQRAQAALNKELLASQQYKEADAVQHVVMKLKDEISATSQLADAREREVKFNQIKESLDSKHIKLTTEQEAQIKSLIATVVEQQKVQQHMNTIHTASAGAMTDYTATLEAINKLYAISPQYIQQYATALDAARMKVLEVNNTVVAGLEHGLLAQLKKVSDVTGTVSSYLTTAFTTTENAWVNFLKTGKMEWTDFAKTLIEQTMHMVTQLLILKPILESLKAGITGSAGASGTVASSLSRLMGFANGGSFIVGGSAATDSNIVSLRATRGERVTVETPQQQNSPSSTSGGTTVHVTINAKDYESFARSQNQVSAAMNRALQKARRVM